MKFIFFIFTSFYILATHVTAGDLQVLTATWAPYNMEENGKLTGIGTEIVQATLEKAGIKADVKLYPWARTYKLAVKSPDTMVYTIIKLPEREALFKWVGPIVPIKSVLHKLKQRSDIKLNSLEDARKYITSTTRNAAGHQFLLEKGFLNQKHIFAHNTNEESVRVLFRGMADLESSVDLNFMYVTKKQGYSYNDVEQAWLLFENEGYIAFSLSTSDAIVNRVQTAFEQIKKAGIVDAVYEKYLKKYQE